MWSVDNGRPFWRVTPRSQSDVKPVIFGIDEGGSLTPRRQSDVRPVVFGMDEGGSSMSSGQGQHRQHAHATGPGPGGTARFIQTQRSNSDTVRARRSNSSPLSGHLAQRSNSSEHHHRTDAVLHGHVSRQRSDSDKGLAYASRASTHYSPSRASPTAEAVAEAEAEAAAAAAQVQPRSRSSTPSDGGSPRNNTTTTTKENKSFYKKEHV